MHTLYNAINLRSNTIAKVALHDVVPTFIEPNLINGGVIK